MIKTRICTGLTSVHTFNDRSYCQAGDIKPAGMAVPLYRGILDDDNESIVGLTDGTRDSNPRRGTAVPAKRITGYTHGVLPPPDKFGTVWIDCRQTRNCSALYQIAHALIGSGCDICPLATSPVPRMLL